MPNQSITLDTDALFNQIKARLEAGSHTAGTAVTPSGEDSAVALAASLCAAARDAISQNPNLQPKTAAKAINPVMVDDPAEITKGWFTSVLHAVTTFGPVFLDAMSKDFNAPAAVRSVAWKRPVPPPRARSMASSAAWRASPSKGPTSCAPSSALASSRSN